MLIKNSQLFTLFFLETSSRLRHFYTNFHPNYYNLMKCLGMQFFCTFIKGKPACELTGVHVVPCTHTDFQGGVKFKITVPK